MERSGQAQGVTALVGQLVDDTRNLASAEIALVKARVGERLASYKQAIGFFVVAGVLAMAALIAMLVGLIATVATLVGPGFATMIVVGITLLLAAVIGMIGKAKLAKPVAAPEDAAA